MTYTLTLLFGVEDATIEEYLSMHTDYDEAMESAANNTKQFIKQHYTPGSVRHTLTSMVKTNEGNQFRDVLTHQLYMGGHPYGNLTYAIRWMERESAPLLVK